MSLCCNFDVIKTDGTKVERRFVACFRDFYHVKELTDQKVKEHHVYILKNYDDPKLVYDPNNPNYKNEAFKDNELYFSLEEINKYLNLLRAMDFKVELQDNVDLEYKGRKFPAYKVILDCQYNTKVGTMFLLNCIRYLYERPHQELVEIVLDRMSHVPKGTVPFKWCGATNHHTENFYNTLIIAHYCVASTKEGHSFKPYSRLLPLRTMPEIIKKLHSDSDIKTLSDYLLDTTDSPYSTVDPGIIAVKKAMIKIYEKTGSISEVLSKYKGYFSKKGLVLNGR